MKKAFIPVVLGTLMLCGCDIYRTYETYEVVKQGVDMTTVQIKALKGDWIDSKEGEGNPGFYVFQQFKFNEITNEIFKRGTVLVYLVEKNPDYTSKHILPYVYPRNISFDEGSIQIMQNIRYEIEPGLLTICVEWQDFYKCDLEDFTFDVCIVSPGEID